MKGAQMNTIDDTNLFKINLQLFADGDEPELELEPDDEDLEIDLDDEDEDELSDIPDDKPEDKKIEGKSDGKSDGKPEDKPKPEPVKKEKTIPISAFKKEKARMQRIIDELKSSKESPKENSKVSKQALVDVGFDEATAEMIASAYGKSASTEKLVNRKFRDMEFKELSKEFPDIEDNRDELEEYAESKGVTIEEAYMAKYGRSKLRSNRADIEREIEQRILDRMKKNGNMKFDATDNGEIAEKSKSGLTSDQKEAAKFLGMSEREYAIFSKAKSFETMDKHLKKKG